MKTIIKAYSLRLQESLKTASQQKKVRNIKLKSRSLSVVFLFQFPILCYALDVDPGDYDMVPPDTTLGLLYMQHAERNNLYQGGDKVSDKHKYDTDIAMLRAVRYKDIRGHLTNFQLILPFAHISTGGESGAFGSESGMGDPILGSAIYTKGSTTSKTLAVTQYLHLPLGRYDKNRPLNIGENRWKYVFQVGHMRALTDKISLDLVADATLFGDNDDYTPAGLKLEQDPQYQMQGFLRYKIGENLSIHTGYSRIWGGETEVEGISQNNESKQEKFMAGGSYFVSPRTQLLATFGRDVSVENGYKEDSRLNLRLLHVF
ncbi:transporter [Stutzerimonas sp. NM35]|uniref:transporter n=1 Tax=Stutzerimonas stutzeri TaxID=316 RepID=UPI0015E34B02|nr:transporter [Stutzerimonas stutzeri]MBA1264648.1 transporter [Stutzerimonas stutzeri]